MRGMPDISTVELSRTRLKLRDDLLFVPQRYDGETFYHLEVRSSSEYFRIGYAEYVFVSLLDGSTSFAEALAVASQQLRQKALSQTQAMSIYSWLLDNNLAAFSDADTAASGALSAVRETGRSASFWKRFNPLWLKIPFGRPQALLKAIAPVSGWMFSGPATVAAILLMTVSGMMLHTHWDQFTAASASVIAVENWLWLLAAWVGLKFFHELGHGLVCHRYGGNIRETGVVLAFLAPLAYVDASSCWSFRSRWQRLHTAMAGIYVELIVASIAIIAWTQTESPLLRHVLQNVITMASISTLLFNLNPLMKFDGYYVLSDLLQIPNLSTQSNSAVQGVVQRVLCGDTCSAPTIVGRRRWILLGYGVASSLWRVMVSLSLLIMASVLFRGAGLALAATGVCLWFGKPLWELLKTAERLRLQHPERLLRASVICGAAFVVVYAALTGLPSPVMTTVPGIVDFRDGEVVRPETAGFVESVHVVNGQNVVEGDLLISLRNDDVVNRLEDLEQRLAQEELRGQTASGEHDSGALNVSYGNRESLFRQLEECREQVNALQIRASRSGQVIGRHLSTMEGTFVSAGMELMTIGKEDEKEVQLSIGQRELALSASIVGRPVQVRIGTHGAVNGTLVRVNPGASRAIPHPALAAINGGALAVSQVDNEATSGNEKLKLTDYRFTAVVQLSEEDSPGFLSGERGTAALGLSKGSLGQHLWRSMHDWFDRQFELIESR